MFPEQTIPRTCLPGKCVFIIEKKVNAGESVICFYLCVSLSQVDRSRRKLPLPPPEGGDGEGEGSLRVVAMYDFTAKEDTDLTLKQVHIHRDTQMHKHTKTKEYTICVMMLYVVSTGRGVHHPSQTRPAVVESAGQTRVGPTETVGFNGLIFSFLTLVVSIPTSDPD